ncbi:hypothetical protein [Streptomyces sp. BH055]|uniref:hypothetical protein n=1 Tax=Streptomyces sp. BH055 TaxID=3401173 RepID=UPI003BB696E7
MNLDALIGVLSQLGSTLQQSGMAAGDVLHSIFQLRDALALARQGYEVTLNQRIVTQLESVDGKILEITRYADVAARKAGELDILLEGKSGSLEKALPTITAAFRAGEQNLQLLHDLAAGATGEVRNIWALYSTSIDEARPVIEKRLLSWGTFLEEAFGATQGQVRRAIESFTFVDAFGEAIRYTWGPHGPIAIDALDAASHSPDFHPAMEALFGPSGKVADAATKAATGANLTPAMAGLEEKLEQGVTGALDKAGTAAAEHGAKVLGEKVSAGATALGAAMTAIPQLYSSVTALGEAWNKPLTSTKDYMDLLAAAGGVVSQAGQVLQAFAGITQIAAAAQAVFNAVMALNPVVLVVIAVIALIAAITLLIVYWDQVKAALRDNPWLAVAASLLGIIGIIVVIIAYWDEIKLAVLRAANFISVQAQRIGLFFVGVGTVIGQVWDVITASVANVGISILNAFITAGVAVQNFFIGVINWVLEQYNKLADSVIGDLVGLDRAELIPEVPVETKLIPPREVPTIDVNAAFATGQVTGGLETQIAAQEQAVAQARKEDERRRAGSAPPPAAAPAAPGAPAGAAILPAPGVRPELPTGAAAAAPAGSVDQSVHVEGGITVNVNAERLEADSAALLSDDIIAQLQQRLGALRSEQDFRTGARPTA